MFQENELITLLVGVAACLFIVWNKSLLKSIPSHRLLFTAFSCALLSWIFTVLEGFFLPNILNAAEHCCYVISSLFITAWIWCVFAKKGQFT